MSTPNSKTYTVEINEYQRCLLFYTLVKNKSAIERQLVGTPGDEAEDTAFGEFQLILEMLADLPNQEKANPGIIHGFCW